MLCSPQMPHPFEPAPTDEERERGRESYNSARERCTKENGNGERQKGGAAVITIYLEETRLNMARVKF